MYQTQAGVAAAMASHSSFTKSSENVRALDLLTTWGDGPAAPPVQPVDHTSSGIEQDENPYRYTEKREAGADAPEPVADAPTDPAGTSTTQPGVGPGSKSAAGDEAIKAATGPVTQPTPGVASSPAASALGGGGMPSMGGTGGMGGMGGGVPKMPGGLGSGGMPGMGSTPLGNGVGQIAGAGSGLPSEGGGVPGTGTGSPAAAFTQGLSTGGAIGGGMPAAPPAAPASPSPALSAGAQATPVSATAGGGVSPAAAHSGIVAPAAAPTGGREWVPAPVALARRRCLRPARWDPLPGLFRRRLRVWVLGRL
jgi:hypothetical protein